MDNRFNIMNNFDAREVIKLPLQLIKPNKDNPYIKEEHLEKIIALKNDILDEGLNNPIVVEDTENGYVINKGHSRYYAYQMINDEKIPGYEEIECYITHFENSAEALRSLMRDNALQKERSPQDKCREVKLYMEKVIPNVRNLPENKGIPTKQLIANDLGMSATVVQQYMTIIKSDKRVLDMFLNKNINIQGAYLIATSGNDKDEVIKKIECCINEKNCEIPAKTIKKEIALIDKNKLPDNAESEKENKIKHENHSIFLNRNLLSITHTASKNPLVTEFHMVTGSVLTVKCWWKLGRVQFGWISHDEEYVQGYTYSHLLDKEKRAMASNLIYSYMISQITRESCLAQETKFNDLISLVNRCKLLVNKISEKK